MSIEEALDILESRKDAIRIVVITALFALTTLATVAASIYTKCKGVRLREIIVAISVAVFAALATWKGMQVVASVAIVLLILVVYRGQTLMLRDIIYALAKNVKQAKYGEFEFQLADGTTKTIRVNEHSNLSEGSQILLASLDSSALGLLAEIVKNDTFPVKEGYLVPLRLLRNMGLITYDGPEIAKSKDVKATQTAKNLIKEFGM